MSQHGPEHADLLARVLVGELEVSAPAVRARLDDCQDCRAELERLRAIDARLRTVVEQERADLAQAQTESGAAEEELVRRSLAQALAARQGALAAGTGRRPRRLLVLALAASLLLFLGWAATRFLQPHPGQGEPEILLGGGAIDCLTPLGAQDGSYGDFIWRFELPPQWSFELTIRVRDDGKGGKELLRFPGLQEARWTPSPELERSLPDEIFWEVTASDDTGNEPPVTGWALASRRR